MSRWLKPKQKHPKLNEISIFDQPKQIREQKRAQAGIEASYGAAPSHWKQAASDALIHIAKNYREFTTDMVMEYLAKTGIHTGEPRALGAIIQGAARGGVIQKTGQYRESYRRHNAPIPVWRSNIYESN